LADAAQAAAPTSDSAVQLGMQLPRLVAMVLGVEVMRVRHVGMVRGLLVVAVVVGLRGFVVMLGRVFVVLGRLLVMLDLLCVGHDLLLIEV
jgi:hypothetical protein